ncbi:hypothetical protein C1645_841150 [Glomus cerebriforme]|uniref:F-box domain-containing protein n=1 Tax=Glomus cerebriforme TaxID=658196 RepID=A0A397RYJ0_9GLOM|nr:hypothetical protein C1645_841150 [Glomus cerebriforme]
MACSKFFSGDLPELLNEIIQYFQNDYKTLYSCILVNKLLCRLIIPLLWEDPFTTAIYKYDFRNYHFIRIYLNNLSDEDKTKLNEYKRINNIDNDLFSKKSNALFNYPSFIKRLNVKVFIRCIEKYLTQIINLLPSHPSNSYLTKSLYELLLKLFIENGANLHTFEAVMPGRHYDYIEYFNYNFIQYPNFICDIRKFKLLFCDDKVANETTFHSFLKYLCLNCHSISSLYLRFSDDTLIQKYLSQMINSQKDLKKITFEGTINNFTLSNPLLSLKNSNCSNTLKTIIFNRVEFYNIVTINEIFEELNVLESIHILNCNSLNSNFTRQIMNMIKPFKLKTLIIDDNEILENSHFESLELLLQKSGIYLENFKFGFEIDEVNGNIESSQLLISITNYCTKIKFLDLTLDDQNLNSALNLIVNIKQSLDYLSIRCHYFESSSIILQNLGQILPSKLEYLNLRLTFEIRTCIIIHGR